MMNSQIITLNSNFKKLLDDLSYNLYLFSDQWLLEFTKKMLIKNILICDVGNDKRTQVY